MKPSINVMLDLETLGTKEYSTIISLGAVWFDPTKLMGERNRAEFYITIDPENATKRGLRMDASMVMRWMQPAQRSALDDWRNTIHFELDVALDGFQQFLLECLNTAENEDPSAVREAYEPWKQVTLWGNGPQFDCMLLRQAYEVCQRETPWMHYNERCFRTIKGLPGARSLAPPHVGLQHNALIDARQQALWLCNILNMIPELGPIKIGKPKPAPKQ